MLSLDPVALSYVLRATDPITLSSGDVLTSDTLVPLLLNDVYQRFNSGDIAIDNLRQDLVYSEAVDATFSKLTSGALDPTKLIAALMQGWGESRVLYWSAHEDEQTQLAAIGLNGELPVSDSETERVGVQLTNTIQQAQVRTLSPSITGQWKREGLKPGVQRIQVFLYAPPGSTITGATINGAPVDLDPHHNTDYPVGKLTVTVTVSVEPGATVSMSYDIVAAEAGEKVLEVDVTPRVFADGSSGACCGNCTSGGFSPASATSTGFLVGAAASVGLRLITSHRNALVDLVVDIHGSGDRALAGTGRGGVRIDIEGRAEHPTREPCARTRGFAGGRRRAAPASTTH